MVRPTLIDMNPVELKYYPFMISLNKYTGICNVFSPKINVNPFNMITNKNQAKGMTEHVLCDCKCKSNYIVNVIQIKNGIIKHVNVNSRKWKKDLLILQ